MKKDSSYPKGTSSAYPKHTIGEHIVPFQLTFLKDETIEKVLSTIQKRRFSWPNTESVFVIDKDNKLVGAIEFKELLTAKPDQQLEDMMNRSFKSLTDHSHQNTAIKLAVKEGIELIPVTDQNGHFLGIIDADQIFKIMHEEHIEKLMHFTGILKTEAFVDAYKSKISTSVRARIPWLILGLIGGIASTFIIKGFDHTLREEIALAFFIPLIVYINAAVGYQTQTIFVRYSSLEKVSLKKILLYELRVAFLISLILSFGVFIFATLWIGMRVAEIVSLSMLIGVITSAIIGISIPWLLNKLGKDPAIGSGPLTTIIQDLLSVAIYFSIASTLL